MTASDSTQAASLFPAGVVDYPARDLTITVNAAISVGELADILAVENQQLPVDAVDPAMTLREFVAQDLSGPRQYGYGTLRDYVIGIEAVDGRGRVFHGGGRVVKNVAGYDLCRLLVGSRGELGTIRQLTFKLKPLPADSRLLVAAIPTIEQLNAALERLNTSAATPVILDVVNRSAASSVGSSLVSWPGLAISGTAAWIVLGVEGPPQACDWQLQTLRDELRPFAATGDASGAEHVRTYVRQIQSLTVATETSAWLACVRLRPSRMAALLAAAEPLNIAVSGRAGNGELWLAGQEPESERAIEPAIDAAVQGGGAVRVLKGTTLRSTTAALPVAKLSRELTRLLGVSPS
jgi:glycolate oxidase FAD binding subunit